MKFAGIFALVVGLLMIGQWAVSLATDGVPELARPPLCRSAFIWRPRS